MYVPATPAQPALALAPVEIVVDARRRPAQLRSGALPRPRCTCASAQPERARRPPRERRRHAAAPASPGARSTLQALGRHGWRTVAHTHTGAAGRFRLRYTPARDRQPRVRLRFAGDALDLPRAPRGSGG